MLHYPRDTQQFLRRYVTMFPRISKLFMVCIGLVVISGIQQVVADEMEAGTWTQKADMPTARALPGSAVVDGKIYVIGGQSSLGSIAVVEEYDPAADTWTTRADMPTARDGVRAAAVDGTIYAIGGWSGPAGPELSTFSTVEAYDPATDTWTTKADMPTARGGSAIAVVDGQIYVIGGMFGPPTEVSSAVEAYDPATDTWTKKTDMPTARYVFAACIVDRRIYVPGGKTKFDPLVCVSTVEVYDPATDTWTQASDMPRARMAHSASVVDGKMYIIGGGDLSEGLDHGIEQSKIVDVYDPATDTWTTAADRPTATGNHTAAVVDGKIYTIGGQLPRLVPALSTLYEFDPGLPGAIPGVR
jgi:N-acetylneuraminic acid mutarotase